jgi:hypothetical protein
MYIPNMKISENAILMNKNNNSGRVGFYDSICTCKKCRHKTARECFEIKCDCCKSLEHSMIMDGFEGFEKKS